MYNISLLVLALERVEEEIGHEAVKMQGNHTQSLCVLCSGLQEKCFIQKTNI
jgi:hypothetical protein